MLMQTVCSEIDVVEKEIANHCCLTFDSEKGDKLINRWWYEIQNKLVNTTRSVKLANTFEVNPWENYRVFKAVSKRNSNGKDTNVTNYNFQPKTNGTTYTTPKWWNAYNKVKHKRVQPDSDGLNYKKANLRNLFNALATLYLLEFEFDEKCCQNC